MSVLTQTTRVLSYLRSGAELTPALAWRDMNIYRLSARIRELRLAGHDIRTRIERNGLTHFAVYSLAKQQEAA